MRVSSILLWNVTSIKNKVLELTLFLENNSIPIAILTETWLRPNDRHHVPNYSVFRKDRPNDSGGGVAILIHKNILPQIIHLPALDIEYVAIKLLTPTLLIIAVRCPTPKDP